MIKTMTKTTTSVFKSKILKPLNLKKTNFTLAEYSWLTIPDYVFNHCSALRLFDHLWPLLKIASFDAPIIFMRELTKFYTYIALLKEYKGINFVIKRNMVKSNEVTWMELYQKFRWRQTILQACRRMSVLSICLQFQLFALFFTVSTAFCSDRCFHWNINPERSGSW